MTESTQTTHIHTSKEYRNTFLSYWGKNKRFSKNFCEKRGACRFKNVNESKIKIKNYVRIPEGNEKILQEAIYEVGPAAAAIDSSLQSFQFYASGN
jgi:hypothetical protein